MEFLTRLRYSLLVMYRSGTYQVKWDVLSLLYHIIRPGGHLFYMAMRFGSDSVRVP